MESFKDAYNKNILGLDKDGSEADLEKPFIGDPYDLSAHEQEELQYRYKYIHDPIDVLARIYRLTPNATEKYILEQNIKQVDLSDPTKLAEFETYVNGKYKKQRIQLTGLVAIHTLKSWKLLAQANDDLLASVGKAAELASLSPDPDPKTLNTLANTHTKLVNQHDMIKQAVQVPAVNDLKGKVDALTKQLEDLIDEIDGDGFKLPSEETNETKEPDVANK